MTNSTQTVMDFLLTRRSFPYRTLTSPAPDRAALTPLLTAAARVPDHGKLEPWRFIILTDTALPRLAALTKQRGASLGHDPEKLTKTEATFANAPLIVAVVTTPKASEKVPEIEQLYSAGAVCLGLLNAALAAGWGANWLSGWPSHDRDFLTDGLNLASHELIAGFIHIGTGKSTPSERPRPDIDSLATWINT
ncbi:nitroreductase [Marinosulfonomonas sp. PRT-SC04]|nr:nitroreductase [Marinosulfonomonas sp. PRT-SC04]